jgi:hypothetical protein
MRRCIRNVLLGGLAAGVGLVSVGCLKCHHRAYGECLQPVERVTTLAPARAKVYVFLTNGADLLDLGGMKELECQIVRAGFPKVYYAQRFDKAWYYKEVHRLRRDDPDNRFVLVGIGPAAVQMQELAACLTKDGIPLDAVVFLDPVCADGDLTTDAPYPTKIIRSHHWRGSPRLIGNEEMAVEGVGHLNLPDHSSTVAAIVEVLNESARKVPLDLKPIDCVPQLDENKPVPRPHEPKVVPPAPPGWTVLCPESGQR